MTFGRHLEKAHQISAQKRFQTRAGLLGAARPPAPSATLGHSVSRPQYPSRNSIRQRSSEMRLRLWPQLPPCDVSEKAMIVVLSAWLLFAAVYLFLHS